ncbi:molybdopterin molybdotransferase MoeA [Celerinatantimonas yamalensis]|uniref:Molybdopterin molybdenumtransferase n=1 Tax=Celerinatantimonas yamalensis TaxID=559956 RepID=A0ABW9G3E8_9GAMM
MVGDEPSQGAYQRPNNTGIIYLSIFDYQRINMDSCSHPELMPLDEAQSYLVKQLPIIASPKFSSYQQSLGFYLASTAKASSPIPSFANSAMDGYAFAYENLTKYDTLTVTQQILAGDIHRYEISAGECAQIMTGAPMPIGADTVIMQEQTSRTANQLTLHHQPKLGANVRHPGETVKQGQIVAQVGDTISAAHIGLFASIGLAQVNYYQPITVGLFSTGDELRAPGSELEFGQIYDSNRAMLQAMLKSLPVKVIDYGVLPDNLSAIIDLLKKANHECDVIISSAGVSVGHADFTKDALETLGQIAFWKVAMKPGKPFAFGRLSDSYFFGLPGNPVSAAVTFLQLVVPALRKLGGGREHQPQRWPAKASVSFKKHPGRVDFQRAIAEVDEQGQWHVRPAGTQSSATLASFIEANCFAVLEQERGPIQAGEMVSIEMIPSLLRYSIY